MIVSVGFSTSKWWVSRVIRFFTGAEVSHAYIVVDAGGAFGDTVYEAAWCGFRMSTRAALTRGSTHIVEEVNVPLDPTSAVAICRAWLETPYDYAGLVGEAFVCIGKLFGLRWRNPFAGPHHMFCSEAATYLLQLCATPDSNLKRGALALDPRTTDPEMLLDVLKVWKHANLH